MGCAWMKEPRRTPLIYKLGGQESMSSALNHKKRSHRNHHRNMSSFASFARTQGYRASMKKTQKENRKSMFDGIKQALGKLIHKDKKG